MKKVIKIFSLVLMTMTVIFSTTAFADIPERSSSFYVADYSNVISQETEDYIVSKNAELEALCGGQIVVVTVDFLDGMDIEDYCYKIFEEWRIGSARENNGVLLLLAIGEEDYWCMQGKGLENTLTSGEIGDMLWNYLEEDFAAGNYDAGVRKFFDEIYNEVSDIYGDKATQTEGGTDFGFVKIVVIALVIVVVIVALSRLGRGGTSRRRTDAGYPPPPPRPPRRPRRSSRPMPSSRPHRPSSRPAARPTYRSSSGPASRSSSSRSSFSGGSSSGGMGHGGGGRSRGGGAGRSK